MSGRISILPNRIKMRRQGESWKDDLLSLLTEMADLYTTGQGLAVLGVPAKS